MTVLESIHPEAVEAHPRVARAITRIAHDTGLPENLVRRHLGEAVLSVLDRFGTEYVAEVTAKLQQIDQIREHVRSFYDRVLSGQDTHPDVGELARAFAELRPLLEAIAAPERWLRRRRASGEPVPVDPVPATARPTAGSRTVPARTEPARVPAGRPRRARTDVGHALGNAASEARPGRRSAASRLFRELSARRRVVFEDAAGHDADYLRSIVNSETLYGNPRDHTRPLTPWRPETFDAFCERTGIRGRRRADLEGALRELNRARRRELEGATQPESPEPLSDSAQQREDLLDDPATALGFPTEGEVAAQLAKAPTMAELAAENPNHFHELALMWLDRVRTGEAGSLRNYVRNLMRSQVRGMLGEFSAVFTLGRDFWVLKGPDFNVTEPGTDYVVVSRRTGELWFCDNKALSDHELGSVTSLVRNIGENMADDVAEFDRQRQVSAVPMPAEVSSALDRGRAASAQIRDLIADKTPQQVRSLAVQREITRICDRNGIRRVVSNSGGELTALSGGLRRRGIDLASLEGQAVQLPRRRLRAGPTGGGAQ